MITGRVAAEPSLALLNREWGPRNAEFPKYYAPLKPTAGLASGSNMLKVNVPVLGGPAARHPIHGLCQHCRAGGCTARVANGVGKARVSGVLLRRNLSGLSVGDDQIAMARKL